MTKQRKLILDIVNAAKDHPTPEDIFLRAKEQMPSIVLATVYNNLNALTKQGLLRRIQCHNSPDRYDNVYFAHDHLICDLCGGITDITFVDLSEMLKKETGVGITSYELNIHHICQSCAQR